MFLLVLVASQVVAEWVEISQNRYRKDPFRRVTLDYEETTKAYRLYTNYSVTERSRSGGVVNRFPNLGNVERVHLPTKKKEERLMVPGGTLKPGKFADTHGVTSIRLSNINDEIEEKNTEKSKTKLNVPLRPFAADTNSTRVTIQKEPIMEHKIINIDPYMYEINHNIKYVQSATDTSKIKIGQLIKKPNVDSKNYFNDNNNKDSGNIGKSSNKTLKRLGVIQDSPPPPTMVDNFKLINDFKVNEINGFHIDKSATQITIEDATKLVKENTSQHMDKNNNEKYDKDAVHSEASHLVNDPKTNTVKMILKFMKVVTDNISRNTRRSFRGKLRYLEGLRNSILANIEARIEQAWPNDGDTKRGRRAARGHVEFPSSEGALMSISFLTFAVFLIKLVLQVIHTYKNKTMMVTPAVVAAVGRAIASFKKEARKQN